MNKKLVSFILIFAVIIAMIFIIIKSSNPSISNMPYVLINDETEKSKIATDSFLDKIIQIKNYTKDSNSDAELLEAAMRIARDLNKVQISDNGEFIEYVPANIIHSIISELTNKKVKKTIQIEDFYYLYDSEKDYYYIIPIGTDWIHCDELKEVRSINNGEYFQIKLSATGNIGYEYESELYYDDITVLFKYCPTNTYIRYQLVSITSSTPTEREINLQQ